MQPSLTDTRLQKLCDQLWDRIVTSPEVADSNGLDAEVDLPDWVPADRPEYAAVLERVVRRAVRFREDGRDANAAPPKFPENYRYLGNLGSGGMGVVYLCEQTTLEKPVAVKFLNAGLDQAQLIREARLAATIHSSHVVQVFDLVESPDQRPMIVMEYVEGESLQTRLKDVSGRLPEGQVIRWMQQSATGMAELAGRGIVHRDLKPGNILITRDDVAKIADFGLAKNMTLSAELTQSGQVLGTPHYMSPEQATDPSSSSTRSDIYSFGATFYHALVGSPPFSGRSPFEVLYKHKTEPLMSPRSINPDLSAEISHIIERCLAKEPTDRYASFEELLRDLKDRTSNTSHWQRILQSEEAAGLVSTGFSDRISEYLRGGEPPNTVLEELKFGEDRVLKIVTGDIVDQDVEAVVSSDDNYLSMGGGVSAAIARRAGRQAVTQARQLAPVLPGRVIVTSAGNMNARFIMHAVTLRFFVQDGKLDVERNFTPTRYLVLEILRGCQYHIETLQVRSIAFPLLGTGAGWLSPEECLETMVVFLSNLLRSGMTPLRDVRIVVHRHRRWDQK